MNGAGAYDDKEAAKRVCVMDTGDDFVTSGKNSVFGFLGLTCQWA